jgi:hypothetical protein
MPVTEFIKTRSAGALRQFCQTLKTFRSLTSKLVVDSRNATKDLHEFKDQIIKLGAGNNEESPSLHEDRCEEGSKSLISH